MADGRRRDGVAGHEAAHAPDDRIERAARLRSDRLDRRQAHAAVSPDSQQGRTGRRRRRGVKPTGAYAARTVSRNLSTSTLSRLLCRDSDCADDSTRAEAVPVSPAPRLTSVMLAATSAVPRAAAPTLRAISPVAAPCSSTACEMVEEISEILPMVTQISLMAGTDSRVTACMSAICAL